MKLIFSIVFFAVLMTISSLSKAKTFRPSSVPELQKTSARILNLDMSSGGTGSIFRSFKTGTHILTNKHVCRLIEQGGYVEQREKKYLISHYKKFTHHDLCLIRIKENLKINLKISQRLAKRSSNIYVSGHPNLLPHITSEGHMSDNMVIELVVGVTECTEEDWNKRAMYCMFLGGIPVIKKFESTVVSNFIMPGSSGSAVFNNKGEIVGVIYAGNGRGLSYGFAVPHIHLLYFIRNSRHFKWVKVGTKVDDKGLKGRIFNFEKCQNPMLPQKLKTFCKDIENNLIWRR